MRQHARTALVPTFRPRLRPIDAVGISDRRIGRAVLLRDTDGVSSSAIAVPPPLMVVIGAFDGKRTLAEIAADHGVPVRALMRVAEELERALLLDSPRYRSARKKAEEGFGSAAVRPAEHAGAAYPADPGELRRFIDAACAGGAPPGAAVVGIVAPHIDPWRGKQSYGAAYASLRAAPPRGEITVILLGTSHAPMKEPFALCRKSFDTPLGVLPADEAAIDAIASASPFDPYADAFNHKREHSLEFQAVFLRHIFAKRRPLIVPILCGLSDCQRTGRSPENDPKVERFIRGVRTVCKNGRGRTMVVAGADLSHVGPRFGDPEPFDDERRRALEAADRESLELATECEHARFFEHVQRDLDCRRVCGLGPIYTMLRLLPEKSRGTVARYEQTIDESDGSIVSHAAVTFVEG